MKPQLLEWLACPACHGRLRLERGAVEGDHVWSGALVCEPCHRGFPIIAGIPRLLDSDGAHALITSRTAARYSHLWSRSNVKRPRKSSRYHVEQMTTHLTSPALGGLVLDAGCGEGIDLANQARLPGVELVGVELSEGGCRTSFERTRGMTNVSVLQGNLMRLPVANDTFDFIYSYGVLHHLPEPMEGLRELVRVLKPGARMAMYVYEDFRERQPFWRALLTLANSGRRLTTRLSPGLLYRLCQIGSPMIYIVFTLPSRVLSRIPGCCSVAATIPFRHGTGPFSLVGDLYDRFSAPIERRYTRADALALLQQAGLEELEIANDRGWIVAGSKPHTTALTAVATERLEETRAAR